MDEYEKDWGEPEEMTGFYPIPDWAMKELSKSKGEQKNDDNTE